MAISAELVVAVGLGLWFVFMGVVAAIRVFKDYRQKGKD